MAARRRIESNRATPRTVRDQEPTASPDARTRSGVPSQASPEEDPFEAWSTEDRIEGSNPFADEESGQGDRELRIAELAYSKAQARGFEPGHELEDWLATEREIDASSARSEYRPAAP
jgi:hypothetical protein